MNQNKRSEKQETVLWFIRLRWMAIILMLVVTLASYWPAKFSIALFPSLAVILLAAIYNTLYPYLIKIYPFFAEERIFTFFRATADITVITILIHFTGGIESFFVLLYLLELTAISAMKYEDIAVIIDFLSCLFFFINCQLERLFILKHYSLMSLPDVHWLSFNYLFFYTITLFLTGLLIIYISSFLTNAIRRKEQEVEKMSNEKIDFMNTMIHELKSPLTSVLGYADLMKDRNFGALTETQENFIGIIRKQAQRILDTINDLLTIARMESGRFAIKKAPADIIKVAQDVTEEIKPQLEARKIELVSEFASDIPLLNLDESKIAEVFTNLLSNALKFSNEGGKIFFSISLTGKEVLVSIRDEGIGIEPSDLPHIFEKFYRAGKESAERKGTGLGLALCKLIVEAHGGKIWAVSAGRNQGAVFYFTIPF